MPDVDLRIRIKADGTAELVEVKDKLNEVHDGAEHAHGALERLEELLSGNVKGALEGVAEGMGGVAVGFAAAGFVAFELAEKFADTFNALQNLHVATGLNVATLGAWKETAAVTGVSADTMALSMQRLGAQIEAGSEKAAEGARLLGIEFADLKAAGPDERLDMIAAAVAKVGTESDTAQAAVKDLFGKGGLGLLPALSQDAVDYREHIHELVTSILGDEATAATEAKAWKESVNTVEVAFQSVLLRMGQAIVEAPKLGAAWKAALEESGFGKAIGLNFNGKGPFEEGGAFGPAASDHVESGPSTQEKFVHDANAALLAHRPDFVGPLPGLADEEGMSVTGLTTEQQLQNEADALKEKERMAEWSARIDQQWEDEHRRFLDRDASADEEWTRKHNEQWARYKEANAKAGNREFAQFTRQAIEDADNKAREEKQAIDDLARSWANLGSDMKAAAGLLQDFGASAHSVGVEAFSALAQGADIMARSIKNGQLSFADMATAAGSMFKAGKSEGAGGILSSGLEGAEIGSMFGPMGAAIGAGAGVLMSGLGALFGGKSEAEKIGEDLGHAVSAGLVKAISDTQEKDHISRTLAEYLNADQIMQETGDASKVFDLMNATKLGAVNGKEGIDELSKAFTDLKTAADGGSVSSEAAMVKMIQRARELGESIPALDAAVKAMAEDAVENLADLVGGQGSSFTKGKDGKATIGGSITADQASADSDIFGVAFNMMSAQDGVVAAAEAMQGSIDDLVAKLPAGSALTGGAAEAAYYSELAKNPLYAGANKSAVAAARIDKDAVDSGYASDVTGKAFSATAVGDYNQAYAAAGGAAGGDQSRIAAEQAVLPLLTQLQKDSALGIKISPEAKNLLAQANKDGMLPALDVQTQQLGYLKDIAENTGGARANGSAAADTKGADTGAGTSTAGTVIPKGFNFSANTGFTGGGSAVLDAAIGGLPAAQENVRVALAGVAGNTKEVSDGIGGLHDAILQLPNADAIARALVSAMQARGM